MIDAQQVIYALERQAHALDMQAARLINQHNYAAEFPAEDAERMREAITVLTRLKGVLTELVACDGVRRNLRNDLTVHSYETFKARSDAAWAEAHTAAAEYK